MIPMTIRARRCHRHPTTYNRPAMHAVEIVLHMLRTVRAVGGGVLGMTISANLHNVEWEGLGLPV